MFNRRGEITTILILGTLAAIGIATLFSSTITREKNTLNTRAEFDGARCENVSGCGGGCNPNINSGCGYYGCRFWEFCSPAGTCIDTTNLGTNPPGPGSCLSKADPGGDNVLSNTAATATPTRTPTLSTPVRTPTSKPPTATIPPGSRGAIGSACSNANNCSSSCCSNGFCSNANACIATLAPAANGSACSSGTNCASGCCSNGFCSSSNVCSPATPTPTERHTIIIPPGGNNQATTASTPVPTIIRVEQIQTQTEVILQACTNKDGQILNPLPQSCAIVGVQAAEEINRILNNQ